MYFAIFGSSSEGRWQNAFKFTVDTTQAGSASDRFILPLFSGETYNFDIKWGDGDSEHISSDSDVTHIYDSSGTYTIEILGTFPRIYFNTSGDRAKVTDITNWGEIAWSSMEKAFWGCINLEMSATDAPNLASVTDTSYMFKVCSVFNSSINHWDTSNVTNMREMLNGCTTFNQPVSFDTSNAQYMNIMFGSCSNFNQSVDDLDFSSATTLNAIFSYCTAFNSSIAMMDTSSCTNFDSMFAGCTVFNQPVSHFDTSSATTFAGMFYGCTAFDQDVSGWDISSLTNCLNFAVSSGFSTTNYDLLLVAWEGKTHNNTVRIDVPCKYSYGSPDDARTRLIDDDSWTVNDDGITGAEFTMTIDTEKAGSASDTFVLPLFTGETYNFNVDWGDGTDDDVTVDTDQTHVYPTTGIKTIKITGTFPRIYFNYSGDNLKITDITQWGNIAWSSMESAFYGCYNLTGTYTDTPDFSSVTSMSYMFAECYVFNGVTTGWDTSSVTDMSYMYFAAEPFNHSVSSFDTSSVTNMSNMFKSCYDFNQSVSNFDTSLVTDMSDMFYDCRLFNQSVSNFNTSLVTDMSDMFERCYVFNQSVSNFNTSNVTDMHDMFARCYVFNQSISNFNTSKVTNMSGLFYSCYVFNQSVSSFDTSLVTNMFRMFYACNNFNQSVSNFDTGLVTTMRDMFNNCTVFNQDISGFDITALTTATDMLNGTAFDNTNYDLLLVAWEGQVEKTGVAFHAGTAKYSLGTPATARAGLVSSSWSITDGGVSFDDAFTMTVDTTKAGSASDTFILPVTTGTYDYWINWGDGDVENITTSSDQTHVYSSGGVKTIKISGTFPRIYFNYLGDRLKLTDITQWGNIAWSSMEKAFYGCENLVGTYTDTPDFSNVTNMFAMFRKGYKFNGITTGWDTSGVTNMSRMFSDCRVFNKSLSSFDTSSVTNMLSMFYDCRVFNQSVSNFDTSLVTTMNSMFYICSVFNQDISGFDITSLTNAAVMLSGTAFNTTNYDLLLVAWEGQVEKTGVTFHAGTAQYNAGSPATARAGLVSSSWSITDGGQLGKTVTANGNAQIDTAQFEVGTSSGLFDGTGDYLTTPDHSDFDFDTGDFTIRHKVRFGTLPSDAIHTIASHWEDVSNFWLYGLQDVSGTLSLRFTVDSGGGEVIRLYPTISLSVDTWYDFQLNRNGNDFSFFLDGVKQGSSVTDTSAIPDMSDTLRIGMLNSSLYLDGRLDELEISKGIARNTTNFTPSTTPLVADAYTVLLLHFEGADESTTFIDSSEG